MNEGVKALLIRARRFLRTYRRVVAALLAGVAVWSGLTALRPALPATVAVLVTSKPLAGGVVISPGDVAVKQLPADVPPAEYLDDPAQHRRRSDRGG